MPIGSSTKDCLLKELGKCHLYKSYTVGSGVIDILD